MKLRARNVIFEAIGSMNSSVIANENSLNAETFCHITSLFEAHSHEGGSEAVSERAVSINNRDGEQIIHDGLASTWIEEVGEFFPVNDFEAFVISGSDDIAVLNMNDECRRSIRFKRVSNANFPELTLKVIPDNAYISSQVNKRGHNTIISEDFSDAVTGIPFSDAPQIYNTSFKFEGNAIIIQDKIIDVREFNGFINAFLRGNDAVIAVNLPQSGNSTDERVKHAVSQIMKGTCLTNDLSDMNGNVNGSDTGIGVNARDVGRGVIHGEGGIEFMKEDKSVIEGVIITSEDAHANEGIHGHIRT